MVHEYEVKRKLQEQSGSYFVILPKLWVESSGLKEGDLVDVEKYCKKNNFPNETMSALEGCLREG
jgi:phosphate uptake regulator